MVSTVGLPPGAVPFCSGCGRTFPLPAAQAPQFGSTPGAGVAGCGAFVVGAVAFAGIAGVAFMLFTSRGSMARHAMQAQAEAQAAAKQANFERAKVLAAQLEDADVSRSMQAWHGLAGCDATDHWGTFDVLDELFRRTHARNALWNLSNGFQMYYGQKGEDAIARELVARKASDEEVDLLCQSLEQYPDSVERDHGAVKGAEIRTRAWHALTKAEAMVDRAGATKRIGLALERVRSKLPAEKR
ncbi:MAG: hypothetical protein FD180_4450 [Planctomycetota bacterium]|nr:MAG: hypothetical protein FD180_4450 [Planctomycetota bacterium]